ncbi:filament-like plant protein 7 [Malania oleifera]|uniref:filament-like plant protein 7 n=1 Tax=Malania oleifera TaxID=397392 RepID=UPI0025ADD120|nr:filament-like plant protein 7 [Malania oleifera]XP_057963660.1 filament-like plant protein 7 [Malania oleifera]XP_057963661.1 filament-like plant protein 7 [Malania oleifera]XP_057963662.1 filament-like plant protein 7 [Malania oleifera]XP_057963663.1 filament-like plant protein 7 [Malania oleifera]XP_057963665.1 filament-like plant protein 7 [Malania oleifera]
MMDHKAWLWRKRSSEKTIFVSEKADPSFKGNEKEGLPTVKAPERSVKNLNEKLASVICDCNAKDELVTKHAKMAQEAIGGRERAEADAVYLNQELHKALQEGEAAEERLTHLDAALKKCMQQLSSVQEKQEARIHDAVMERTREFEQAQKKLEENLAETSKRLANLAVENTHMSKALLVKEKLIEDLIKCKSQRDAEFNALMSRLDSSEKENAFLRYEFHMLEKELEIRNEEREFTRRSMEASHLQHLESVKTIAKLEAECQRLRVLLRKRLPGPGALAKMKGETEMLGRDQTEMRRRKLNPLTGGLIVRDPMIEKSPEIPSKKISYLIERLCDVEEENKALKEIITRKNDEIRSSRIMCAQTNSKLALIEAQLGELSKGQKYMELTRCSPISNELSLTSGYDIGSGDDISCSGSWASALMTELEHFRNGKTRNPSNIEVSDIRLMDDFVEMEKLAIVSVDTPFASSHVSSDACSALRNTPKKEASSYHPELTGKELVPVAQSHSGLSDTKQCIQPKDEPNARPYDWIQHVLKAILEENRVSKRSLDELLEEIRIAVAYINHPSTTETDVAAISGHPRESDTLDSSGYITWRSPNTSPMVNPLNKASSIHRSSEETSSQHIQSNLCKSICRIIELIEGICLTSSEENNNKQTWLDRDQNAFPYKNSMTADYLVRVFQWRSSEISVVLQQFIQTCNDLLKGEANLEKFIEELTSALDWVMTKCITCQDVTSTSDKIKKHFGWEKSLSDNEFGARVCNNTPLESDKTNLSEEHSSSLPPVASSNGQNRMILREKIQPNLQEENRELEDKLKAMESEKKDLEARLQLANDKNEVLTIQLQESEQSTGSLRRELETLKASRVLIEDQIENQKLINEDLDTQLSVAKVKLNEVLQKLSSLEVELEDKSNCCEELEAMCLELQLQLESIAKKEIPKYNVDQEGKQLQSGLEITAASVKLAECQETILNLGKQLKALASPREAALFDKVLSTSDTTKYKNLSHRSSLRDRMKADDGNEVLKSSKIIEIISTIETQKPPGIEYDSCHMVPTSIAPERPPDASLGIKQRIGTPAVGTLAVVPNKKLRGGVGGFVRKLLLRRKRSKKTSISLAH